MDHLSRGSLQLDALATLVLDEADRMLDMGFFDDIAYVGKGLPARATARPCCSRPPTRGVVRLARQFMRQPQEIALAGQHAPTRSASASMRSPRPAPPRRRPAAAPPPAGEHLAFCNTKQQCRDLIDVLHAEGFPRSPARRARPARPRPGDGAVRQPQLLGAGGHRRGRPRLDIASSGGDQRGRDPDPELHIHRIGRTGRADGTAGRSAWSAPTRRTASPPSPAPTASSPSGNPSPSSTPKTSRCPSRRWSRCRSSAGARRRSAPATCSAPSPARPASPPARSARSA